MACEVNQNSIEMGMLALENRDYITATQIFSNAIIENNNSNPDYWCCLAESLFYQSQFESALQCWHEAAAKNPHSKEIWIRISALYALLEQDDLAIYYYKLSEDLPIDEL